MIRRLNWRIVRNQFGNGIFSLLDLMKLKFLSFAVIVASFLFVLNPLLQAQVDVVGGKVRVGVSSFDGTEGAAATKVFMADLQRTLLIDPVSGKGDKFTATGTVTSGGLTGKLTDRNNANLVEKTYSGDWRSATHQFADDVTLAVTGVQGFATTKVAFISSQSGQKELYVMDIDGGNVRQLTQDHTISNSPAWSRDGRTIAYTSYKSGYPDVYEIKVGTGARTRVAFFPGMNSGASFSPDDSRLALTLSKDGTPEIYTMSASGGSATRLTRMRGTQTSPSWSPSGDQIIFSSDDRGTPQLFTISSNGGEMTRLVTNTPYNTKPDWSPDGKWIAYTMRQGGQFQIGVYSFGTHSAQQVSNGNGEDPSWTRNSRHLVYANGGALYLLDTMTKLSTRLENGLSGCSEPAASR